MPATKVISVRIPTELYEEITDGLSNDNQTISEWLFLRISWMNRFREQKGKYDKYLNAVKQALDEGYNIDGYEHIEYLKGLWLNVC